MDGAGSSGNWGGVGHLWSSMTPSYHRRGVIQVRFDLCPAAVQRVAFLASVNVGSASCRYGIHDVSTGSPGFDLMSQAYTNRDDVSPRSVCFFTTIFTSDLLVLQMFNNYSALFYTSFIEGEVYGCTDSCMTEVS